MLRGVKRKFVSEKSFISISTRDVTNDIDGFFDWQGVGEVNSVPIDDERNAGRQEKTQIHVALWVEYGSKLV
jgi:hypothetical protein